VYVPDKVVVMLIETKRQFPAFLDVLHTLKQTLNEIAWIERAPLQAKNKRTDHHQKAWDACDEPVISEPEGGFLSQIKITSCTPSNRLLSSLSFTFCRAQLFKPLATEFNLGFESFIMKIRKFKANGGRNLEIVDRSPEEC
jgi:hypothetical protein